MHVDANYILDDVDVDAVVVGAIADVVVDVNFDATMLLMVSSSKRS